MALRIVLSIFAVLLFSGAALADDWMAERLRGRVFQLVQGEWQVLHRGDIVPDERVLRTTRGGRVKLTRGGETIELGGDTQVQIIDRDGRKFTHVTQYFGTVAIEADVKNVEHFAVQTPFMAAVVKGTKFVVQSGRDNSKVDVLRGRVAVKSEATRSTTTISGGQSASAAADKELSVAGRGELPPIVTANGVVKPSAGSAHKARPGATREHNAFRGGDDSRGGRNNRNDDDDGGRDDDGGGSDDYDGGGDDDDDDAMTTMTMMTMTTMTTRPECHRQ